MRLLVGVTGFVVFFFFFFFLRGLATRSSRVLGSVSTACSNRRNNSIHRCRDVTNRVCRGVETLLAWCTGSWTVLAVSAADQQNQPTGAGGDRDHYVDLLRVGALGVVVLWHLVLTIPWWSADGPHVSNVVAPHLWLWPLTWITPMPLFFIAGGWANGRALADGTRSGAFLRRRCSRLLRPALPLVAVAAAAWIAAGLLDDPRPARTAIKLGSSHLWFLGVYIAVTLLAPLTHRLARGRLWPVPFLVLLAAAAAGDVGRFAGDGTPLSLFNMVTAWAVVHQTGYHFDWLRAHRRAARAIAATAAGVAAFLCLVGPYAWPMVGVPGGGPSNLGPATVALACVGVFQGAFAAVLEPVLARRARILRTVRRLASWSMPVYMWHLPAYVAVLGAWALVGLPMPRTDALVWWLTRPVVVLASIAVAAALISVARARPSSGSKQTTVTSDRE